MLREYAVNQGKKELWGEFEDLSGFIVAVMGQMS